MAGYGYQEREPSLQVNWAEVGSNINAVLKEESRVREEKKAAIDEATRNYQKVLSEGVRGESKTLNEAAIQFSADAQEQMLMQERLLKSGALNPRDYAVMRQNLTDGTDAAFSLMQEYQDVYAEKMQRIKDGKAQDLEAWMMSNVEGFANFSKAGLVINPENGKVNAAYRVKDPETGEMVLSTDPNHLVDVGALRGQIAGYYDNYDLEGATAKWASETGVWKTAAKVVDGTRTRNAEIDSWMNPFAKLHTKEELMALGLSEEEAETMNYYFRAEDDWITGQMSNPYNMSSVLTNFVNTTAEGAEYTFTYDVDEAKKDPNLILLGADNLPVFDPKVNPNAAEQEKQVRAFMKMSIRNKMDVTQDKQSFNEYRNPNPPQQWQIKRGDDKKKQQDIGSIWNKIYSAPAAEKKKLVGDIVSSQWAKDNELVNIDMSTPGQIKFEYLNPAKNFVKSYDPNNITPEGWAGAGSELHGITDPKEAMRLGGGFAPDATFTNDFTGVKAGRQGVAPEPLARVKEHYSTTAAKDGWLSSGNFYKKNNADVINTISAAVSLLGGEITDVDSMYGFDGFKVKNAKGTVLDFNTDKGSEKDALDMRNALIAHLLAGQTKTTAENLIADGTVPARSGGALLD